LQFSAQIRPLILNYFLNFDTLLKSDNNYAKLYVKAKSLHFVIRVHLILFLSLEQTTAPSLHYLLILIKMATRLETKN